MTHLLHLPWLLRSRGCGRDDMRSSNRDVIFLFLRLWLGNPRSTRFILFLKSQGPQKTKFEVFLSSVYLMRKKVHCNEVG